MHRSESKVRLIATNIREYFLAIFHIIGRDEASGGAREAPAPPPTAAGRVESLVLFF